MSNLWIIIVFLIIIIIFVSFRSHNIEGFNDKINTNRMVKNAYNTLMWPVHTFENPGGLVNQQVSEVGGAVGNLWKDVEAPVSFARQTYYDLFPNFTWVTRYYDKKNDWIRANKGLPPLTPSPTASVAKINMDYKTGSVGIGNNQFNQSLADIVL
jgi:hypothetical protein